MIETHLEYFNGISAKPKIVRIEVLEASILIYDEAFNTDNGLKYNLNDCHYIIAKEFAFIYLNEKSTEYIVIQKNSDYFEEIINLIKSNQKSWHHNLMKQKWFVLLFTIIALGTVIYFTISIILPKVAIHFISEKQESALGNQFFKSFIEDSKIDSNASYTIQKFADELNLSNKYKIKIVVVKDTTVNAFALPGGYIVVYSGILRALEKPSELVALLSHETSHINKRHSLKSMLTSISSNFAISLLTSDINGISGAIISNVNLLRGYSYSRTLEKEADDEGMNLMVANNLNPIGMKWLMEDLAKANNDIPTSISFLSTHPLTTNRIKDAADFSKKHSYLSTSVSDNLQSLWNELHKE
jgi:Zn-dependent protease with chaperone function